MNCEKIRSQLSPYIDGELNDKESFFIREHISICPDCRQEEETLRKTSYLMRNWESMPTPDDFCEALLAKAENMSRQSWRSAVLAVRPFAGPKAFIKVAIYGAAVLLLCSVITIFAITPFKKTPMVEPHSLQIEAAKHTVDKNTQDSVSLPKYTTMAEIKVLGIWE